jgi:hypothetical protein
VINKIADMIVQEALSRKGDFPSKINEVNIEVTLILMEVLCSYREGERYGKRKQSSRLRKRSTNASQTLSQP